MGTSLGLLMGRYAFSGVRVWDQPMPALHGELLAIEHFMGPLLEGRGMLFRVTDHYSSTNLDLDLRKRLCYCHEPMIYTEYIPSLKEMQAQICNPGCQWKRVKRLAILSSNLNHCCLLFFYPYFPFVPFPNIFYYFIIMYYCKPHQILLLEYNRLSIN